MHEFWEDYLKVVNGQRNENPSEEKKYIHDKALLIKQDIAKREKIYNDIVKKYPYLSLDNTEFPRLGKFLMDPSEEKVAQNVKLLASLHTSQGKKDFAMKGFLAARENSFCKVLSEKESVEYAAEHLTEAATTFFLTKIMEDAFSDDLFSEEFINFFNNNKPAYKGNYAFEMIDMFASDEYLNMKVDVNNENIQVIRSEKKNIPNLFSEEKYINLDNYLDYKKSQLDAKIIDNKRGMTDRELIPDEYSFKVSSTHRSGEKFEDDSVSMGVKDDFFENSELVNLNDAMKYLYVSEGKNNYIESAMAVGAEGINDMQTLFNSEKNRQVPVYSAAFCQDVKDALKKIVDNDFNPLNIFQNSSPEYKDMRKAAENLDKLLSGFAKEGNLVSENAKVEMIKNSLDGLKEKTEAYLKYKQGDKNPSKSAIKRMETADYIMNSFFSSSDVADMYEKAELMDVLNEASAYEKLSPTEKTKANLNARTRDAVSTIKETMINTLKDQISEYGFEDKYSNVNFDELFANHTALMGKVMEHIDNVGKQENIPKEERVISFAEALKDVNNPNYERNSEMITKWLDKDSYMGYALNLSNMHSGGKENVVEDQLMKLAYEVSPRKNDPNYGKNIEGPSIF